MLCGSSICASTATVAGLCLCLAAVPAARGEDDARIAPRGSRVEQAARIRPTAPSGEDAVSAWLDQTVSSSTQDRQFLHRGARGRQASGQAAAPVRARTGLRTIASLWPLGVVLGTIAVVAVVARRWLSRAHRLGGTEAIKVLARHYLSSKQSLCLLRLGRRVLLVGVTPERISNVAEIDDPEESAEIIATLERSRPGSFTSAFARFMATDPSAVSKQEPIAADAPLAGEHLAQAGANLRDLVRRIRVLRGSTVSTEST